MFNLFGGGAPGPPAEPDHTLNAAQLHELHAQYRALSEGHARGLESLMSKLTAENAQVKAKLAAAEDQVRLLKAGRKESTDEMSKLQRQLLVQNDGALAVVILDFEMDLFAPSIFHKASHAGRHAARTLRDKIRGSLPVELDGSLVTAMVFIFLSRKHELALDLIAEGLIQSPAQLDEFIALFNRSHPLYVIIESSEPNKEITLQRQRALAAIFTRNAQCRFLVLGRWALDLELMEMVAPSRSKPGDEVGSKPRFHDKIRFVEPFPGTWIAPQFRSREPRTVSMRGVLRVKPLRRGRAQFGLPKLNMSRGLHEQDPPICLDYFLLADRCPRENCPFCHTYRLPPLIVDELRHQIAATPCAIAADGYPCLHGEECFFAHECPRGLQCRRRGCDFPTHMHPPLPAAPAPPPVPTMPYPQPGAWDGGAHTSQTYGAAQSAAGSAATRLRPAADPAPFSAVAHPAFPATPTHHKPSPGPSASSAAHSATSPIKKATFPTATFTSPKPASAHASPHVMGATPTSPRKAHPSTHLIESWAQGVESPAFNPEQHLPHSANPLGAGVEHGVTHSGAPAGGGGAQGEFEELTDEQFEALRAQYAREEQEMLAAMSPGQVGPGAAEGGRGPDHEDGRGKAGDGKQRPDSVLFGVDKPSKTAPKEKDIWSGRKQEGVV